MNLYKSIFYEKFIKNQIIKFKVLWKYCKNIDLKLPKIINEYNDIKYKEDQEEHHKWRLLLVNINFDMKLNIRLILKKILIR